MYIYPLVNSITFFLYLHAYSGAQSQLKHKHEQSNDKPLTRILFSKPKLNLLLDILWIF